MAQLYTLTQVPAYEQYLPEGEHLDAARIKHIFRFAFEENMRRRIKDGAEPLTKGQVLKILFPDALPLASALFAKRQEQIKAGSVQSDDSSEAAMEEYKYTAQMLRKMDSSAPQLDP